MRFSKSELWVVNEVIYSLKFIWEIAQVLVIVTDTAILIKFSFLYCCMELDR